MRVEVNTNVTPWRFFRTLIPYLRIDAEYIDNSTPEQAYRLETYRSTGSISALSSQQLRCYFITRCHFAGTPPKLVNGKTDIRSVSDPVFLERASEHTIELYQEIMWQVEMRYGPVINVFEVEGSRERRVVIGYKMGATARFFRSVIRFVGIFSCELTRAVNSALSNLYHFYSLYSARKYVGAYLPLDSLVR